MNMLNFGCFNSLVVPTGIAVTANIATVNAEADYNVVFKTPFGNGR